MYVNAFHWLFYRHSHQVVEFVVLVDGEGGFFYSCWVFSLERLDEVGQIVAQMWGLIVGYIFPCHSKAIGVVVHQCGNPIVGGKGRGIDVYCRTVCLAPVDDFLSPVSEEVKTTGA